MSLKFCNKCGGLMKTIKSNNEIIFKCKCGTIEQYNVESKIKYPDVKETCNISFSNALREKGIKKLIHITDYSNLPSILCKGLFSRNKLRRHNIPLINHASENVQRKCEKNMKINYDLDICDYVRLFFKGNTPMLRDICFNKKKHNRTIILQIEPEIVDDRESHFTDISCSRREFEWFNSTEVEKLENLDWEVLDDDFDLLIRNCEEETVKKEYIGKRGAEILILEEVPTRYIVKKILSFSFKTAGHVFNLLEENNISDIIIKIDDKRKYFPAFPYSRVYWDKVGGKELPQNRIFTRDDIELWKKQEGYEKSRIRSI